MNAPTRKVPPTVNELRKYGVNVPDSVVAISQPLYHYQTYAAAGQNRLTFFETTVGAAAGGMEDTNMEQSGTMPAPKRMLVTGIQVVFFPGGNPGTFGAAAAANNWNDAYTVFKSGWLDFFVGSASWLKDGPVGKFANDFRLAGTAALADASTVAANQQSMVDYATFAGRRYDITPVELRSNQNFNVTLNWNTLAALPSTVAGRIGVILDGYQYRLSQ